MFVTRVCILMRGLGTLLGADPISLARAWRPLALRVLEETRDLEGQDEHPFAGSAITSLDLGTGSSKSTARQSQKPATTKPSA